MKKRGKILGKLLGQLEIKCVLMESSRGSCQHELCLHIIQAMHNDSFRYVFYGVGRGGSCVCTQTLIALQYLLPTGLQF